MICEGHLPLQPKYECEEAAASALRAGSFRSVLLVLHSAVAPFQTKSPLPTLLGKASPCFYTARLILSRIDVGIAAANSSEGSQESETLPVGQRLASGNASLLFMSGLDAPGGSLIPLRLRRFPPSLPSPSVSVSLPAPIYCASTTSKNLPPPARPARSNGVADYFYSCGNASAGKTLCGTHQRCTVQRLPRPTGLPAHYFRQSDVTAVAVTPASQK